MTGRGEAKLRVGLIGCGKVANLHARALAQVPEAELVAVCSRSADKAAEFAGQYGVAGYADLSEMIERERVQVLIICTPHPNHAAPAITAARAGVHLLIEKPLASSVEDCDAILAAARDAGVKVSTVSQRRFYPPAMRIHNAIADGKLGRPVLGIATIFGWRDEDYYRSDPWRGKWDAEGGGVLVNQAPHQLDMLLWYMGEMDEVFGYWANLNHPYIEVEDTAVAVVRFKSGGLGNIMVSNSQNPAINARVSVHGSNGASAGVQTDGGAMFVAGQSGILEAPFNDLWTIPGEEGNLPVWKEEDAKLFASVDPTTHFHGLQIRDFVQSIMGDREPLVTGEDGRRTTQLFAAIYKSNQTGRPVKL
jgi:predicted dehydrogenase